MPGISKNDQALNQMKTNKANSAALVKILSIICLKLRGAQIKALKKGIADPNYEKAMAFLNEYSDSTLPFRNMFNNMLKKSTDVQPFAEPLAQYLRKMINSNNLKNNVDLMSAATREVLAPCLTLLGDYSNENAFLRLNKTISGLDEPRLTAAYVELYNELASITHADPEPEPQKPLLNKPQNLKPQAAKPATLVKPQTDSVPEGTGPQTIANIGRKIRELGKQITGQDNITIIPVKDKDAYKAQNPEKAELIKQFDKLRKQLTDAKNNAVRSVVTESGKQVLTVRDVVRGLKAKGYKQINIPEGLLSSTVVYMNADAQYCDAEGRVAVRQGSKPGAIFEHNTDYQHDTPKKNWLYRIKTTTDDGKPTVNYVQTEAKVAAARAARFTKIDQALESGIDSVKESWRGSMEGNLDDQRTVYANIAEYMFWTASRVGSGEGMTGTSRTYGATNFLVRHIENLPKTKDSVPSRLIIKYPIKSGATETFTLTSATKDLPTKDDSKYLKQLIGFIVKKAQGKKPDDVVFTIKGKKVNSDNFNGFIKSVLGNYTAKDFRTLRGTDLAAYALGEAKKEYDRLVKQSKKETVPASTVNQLFDAAMTSVGELLGHVRNTDDEGQKITPNTAIKSYVNPHVMVDWYKSVNTAPPKKVISAARMAGIEV